VHVEAGITIKQLLADLASVDLALPTMGAGGGQSLAGALSTGTHGSDVNLPPLGDFVRAVHIVGPGGQEWWIEPADGLVGGPNLGTLPGYCPGTWVVRDDDWFHAALVTIGRFGVVYSMVLEVNEQYHLHETTNLEPGSTATSVPSRKWSDERHQLHVAVNRGYDASGGVFDVPLQVEGEALRFFSVAIDLAKGEDCWVTRRWKTSDTHEKGLDPSSGSGLDAFLCSSNSAAMALVSAVTLGSFPALKAEVLGVPGSGPVWAVAIDALEVELLGMATNSENMGDFLAQAFGKAASVTAGLYGPAAPELHALITHLSSASLGGAQDSPRQGPSQKILDTHDYRRDGCLGGNSSEFFFDAQSADCLKFVSDVLKAAQDLGPVPGYVSLRFIRASQASLAMERFPLTVAIEVAVPRGRSSDQFPDFMTKLGSIAEAHGAIPHWGQQHTVTPARVQEIYGDGLEAWRWAVAELEGGGSSTFSSKFCVDRGLEPARSIDYPTQSIDNYRTPRCGGVLASIIMMLM
jgi:hypothetical protein